MYWVICVPTAAFLAFRKDLGVLGLQLGFTITVIAQATAYGFMIARQNWQEIADKAVERI